MNLERVGRWIRIEAVAWVVGTVLCSSGLVLNGWLAQGANRREILASLTVLILVGAGLLAILTVLVSHVLLALTTYGAVRKSFRLAIIFWFGALGFRVFRVLTGSHWGMLSWPLGSYSLFYLMQAHAALDGYQSAQSRHTFEEHFRRHGRVFVCVLLAGFGIALAGLPQRIEQLVLQLLIAAIVCVILLLEASLAKSMWQLGTRLLRGLADDS